MAPERLQDDAPPGRAQMSPLARMTMIGYGVGAPFTVLIAHNDRIYRPEGRPLMIGFGVVMLGFALLIAVTGQETQRQSLVQNVFVLGLVTGCGHFAADRGMAIAIATAAGTVSLGAAMRMPRRIVWVLMLLAQASAGYVVATAGLAGWPLASVALLVAGLGLVPPLTVMHYRRQLDLALIQVNELATTDVLTGLVNRRGMFERVPLLFAEAARTGRSVAVLMADIDSFKQFNDRFGHQAGDEALRAVADVVASSVRESDITARFGGEELCVIASIGPGDDLLALAERIRKNVEAAVSAGVTVSIGGSLLDSGDTSSPAELLHSLIGEADGLLYEAKRAGRNLALVKTA